jgi:uncharacterized protein (DUF58 family)
MRSLTRRGRLLVVVGVIGMGAAWGLGQAALAAVAALLVLLPLAGVLSVRRSRFVLGSARTVTTSRIPFGGDGEVVLTVENGSRFTSGVLLLEDQVPESLGQPTRLLLDRIPARAQRSERYPVVGRQRGRTRIGPLTVVVTDPFGMATMSRSFDGTNAVMVTPRIVPLDGARASMTVGGHGDMMFRALSARGDDDLLPREHRQGDDMRRIHWPATARQGDLMVRREEQAWHSALTVVLDDAATSHRGTGAGSTFEWAVSAAASIALHFLQHGWRLTVVTTSGRLLVEARVGSSEDIDLVLQAFADVRPVTDPAVPGFGLDSDATTGVVAVLGDLAEAAARTLPRPTSSFAACLLLDPGPAAYLRDHGWRVATWDVSTPIAGAWQQIAPATVRPTRGFVGQP